MVQGLAEFNRRWSAIPKAVRKNVRYAMEESADGIVAQMYVLAPHLTGDLAGSINWTWGDAPKGSMTVAKVGAKSYGTMRITIYAGGIAATARNQNRSSGTRARDQGRSGSFETDVARLQEFGTVNMPANPFFFVTWRLKRRGTRTKITSAIKKSLK